MARDSICDVIFEENGVVETRKTPFLEFDVYRIEARVNGEYAGHQDYRDWHRNSAEKILDLDSAHIEPKFRARNDKDLPEEKRLNLFRKMIKYVEENIATKENGYNGLSLDNMPEDNSKNLFNRYMQMGFETSSEGLIKLYD